MHQSSFVTLAQILCALFISIGIGAGCKSQEPAARAECTSNNECEGGQICVDGRCTGVCGEDADCREGDCCRDGVCEPCEGYPPAINSINGTGSSDEAVGHTPNRIRDRLVIKGKHLADASVILEGIDPPVGARELSACAQPTETELQVALPADLVPGQYTLTVANQAGQCSAETYILQGEPGVAEDVELPLAVGALTIKSDTVEVPRVCFENDDTCMNSADVGQAGNLGNPSDVFISAGQASEDSGDIIFESDAIERARLTSTGNLGIGTQTPTGRLEVWPPFQYAYEPAYPTSADDTPVVDLPRCGCDTTDTGEDCPTQEPFETETDFGNACRDLYSGDTNVLVLQDAVRPFIVSSRGRVGIGTAAPTSALDVAGTLTVENLDVAGDFLIENTAASAIGIGTANPSDTVHVKSDGGLLVERNDAQGYVQLFNNADDPEGTSVGIVAFQGKNSTGNRQSYADIQAYADNAAEGSEAGSLSFRTARDGGQPEERMRIESDGNVLVRNALTFGGRKIARITFCTYSGVPDFDGNNIQHAWTAGECDNGLPSGSCLAFMTWAAHSGRDEDWRVFNPGESGFSNGGMRWWNDSNPDANCNVAAVYMCDQ